MTDVIFYKYSGERNRLNKTLGDSTTLQLNFNEEFDKIYPKIKITSKDGFDFNYVYFPTIGRYYFIDKVVERRNGFYELNLTLDVLMTFKDIILNLYGTVTQRTQFNFMSGSNIPVDVRTQIDSYPFNEMKHDTSYVLITTGYISK